MAVGDEPSVLGCEGPAVRVMALQCVCDMTLSVQSKFLSMCVEPTLCYLFTAHSINNPILGLAELTVCPFQDLCWLGQLM